MAFATSPVGPSGHTALAPYDEFRALHRAVAPDFGVVPVVTDNQTDFETFRAFRNESFITGVPAFNRTPGQNLPVLLHDFTSVIYEYKCIVRVLARVFFMLFPSNTKDAPALRSTQAAASVRLGRDCGCGGEHFFFIVHDPCVEYSGKISASRPGRPAFVPMMSSQMFLTLAITCSLVWRRGILYWKTQVPTVSARRDVAVAGHGRLGLGSVATLRSLGALESLLVSYRPPLPGCAAA